MLGVTNDGARGCSVIRPSRHVIRKARDQVAGHVGQIVLQEFGHLAETRTEPLLEHRSWFVQYHLASMVLMMVMMMM